MGRYKLFLGLLLFLCALSSAAHIVVNSQDYRDVASAAFYANLKGDALYYVYPSVNLQTAVLQVGPKEIILMESGKMPVHSGYPSALQNNGATISERLVSDDAETFNLELAERSGATSFILTDPAYGYNLVSLFGYAKASGSYVIFATKKNAGQVSNFLSSHTSRPVLIYGTVDQQVLDSLSSRNINSEKIENGDKYLDNSALLERFFERYDSQKQIVFAEGAFFEPSITEGVFPVMLVSNTIPPTSYDTLFSLVSQGKVSTSVLVKGDYTSAVYNLMKTINAEFETKQFSVFVKMGQASSPGEVQALSVYPIPAVVLDIRLNAVQYNTAKEAVELILENKGSVSTYTTSSINVYSDGTLIGTVGDNEAQLVAKDEVKGFSYPLKLENPGQLTANITTYFSSSKYAYEKALTAFVDMGTVSFTDGSMLEIATASYSPDEDAVSLKVANPSEKEVYFRTTVEYSSDISSSTVNDPQVRTLAPGQSTVVRMSGLLITPEELPTVSMEAVAEFGGREEFLVNEVSAPVEILEPQGLDMMLILGAMLILLLIILAVYFLTRKKEKKDERHKTEKKK